MGQTSKDPTFCTATEGIFMRHPRPRTSVPIVAAVVTALAALTGAPALAATGTSPRAPQKVAKTSADDRIARAARGTATQAAARTAASSTAFASRVTARAVTFTDTAGKKWAPRPVTFGTRKQSTRLVGQDVTRTTQDALYQVNAWGVKGYSLPVPAPGTYTVRILTAEDTFDRAGKRVFDVVAEKRTVGSRVDIAKAVGRGAAHDIVARVPVTDGRLDLSFVKRVDEPLVAAIEVTGTVPAHLAAGPAPTQAVRFAPGNVFTTRVDTAPLAPNSAAAAAKLTKQVQNHWGGTAGVSAYAYGVGFNVAPRGTKRITIGFHDCQKKRHIPSGLYDGAKHFVSVPVPADATPAAGTDAEMTIYDPAADQMWDFWQMRRNTTTRAWEACWGGRIDKVSTVTRPAFENYFGASASGLAVAGGMITVEDMLRGRIDHAMSISLIDVARWDKVSWPASRSDGISTDPDAIAEGQRIRLDPALDLDRLQLTPFARMVAEAAQKYGFIVMDKGGAVAVATEAGDLAKRRTGQNPWDTFLAGPAYDALAGFPWQHAQILPMHYGRP